ncbi:MULTISPECIES: tandem-95 repeat protein [Paenibacillus]|uniref:tandem-95 repeat protein n=1 Tax=Paenibacillus TaxID=44249 RepID=UPI002FE3792A
MKKKIAILAVSSLIALTPQHAFYGQAQASPMQPTLLQDGTWGKPPNVIMDIEQNLVGKSADAVMAYYRSALQFQLPDLTGQSVTSAKLRIKVDAIEKSDAELIPFLTLYGSTVDSWGDSFPLNDTDQALGTKTGSDLQPGWLEYDVTDFVSRQTDGIVSFALLANETFGGNVDYLEIFYNSNDAPFDQPELVLVTEDAAPPVTPSQPPGAISETVQEDAVAEGLVVAKVPGDTSDVTHFKITNITGGKLYRFNDTVAIQDGEFITSAEGSAGLKFVPNPNANSGDGAFSFLMQAAQDATGKGLSGTAEARITVTAVNDSPIAHDDALPSIEQNSGDYTIPASQLLGNDDSGAVNENDTLRIASVSTDPSVGTVKISQDGNSVIFTPAHNYAGPASFTYEVQDNGLTGGNPDPKTSENEATVTFQIEAVSDIPSVTDATTAEDQQTQNGLVITANSSVGAPTNYYKITGITGGILFKTNGTAPIAEGSFITVSEGLEGLKFTPSPNAYGTSGFGFSVQAAPETDGKKLSGKAHAQITVTEVNDPPVALNDTWDDIDEDAAPVRIPISHLLQNDSAGAFNENDQTLTVKPVNDSESGTVRLDGGDLVFTPKPNYNGAASFKYKLTDNGTTHGEPSPEETEATVSFTIRSVADIPVVTDAVTEEDTQTSEGLQIGRNAFDGVDVQYLKITDIQGGTLYKNDGTTPIPANSYVTMSEGSLGLKFSPNLNANSQAGDAFSFKVQAATGQDGRGLSDPAKVTISVNTVNDAPVAVDDDHLEAVPENSGEHTILASELLKNDSKGADNEFGQTLRITSVEKVRGGDVRLDDFGNVVFTPEPGFRDIASFRYRVEDDGGVESQALAFITVAPLTDRPQVTGAETEEDTMNSTGLVIIPTDGGGSPATHFKISGITGGRLFQHNGSTPIQDGEFITVLEGADGLKFMPNENAHGSSGFGFMVQAAADGNGALLSDAAEAVVHVTEVNDAPVAKDDRLGKVKKGTEQVNFSFNELTANDEVGPPDEALWQSLTITDVQAVEGGTVELANGRVEFRPSEQFTGLAKFNYTVTDNGRTGDNDDPRTHTAEASFYILDEDQPFITLAGEPLMYLLKGEPYVEPGYSAEDEVDGDLTERVTVTGDVYSGEIGPYILRYNVEDNSGNAAPETTRTVQVVSGELVDLSIGSATLTPLFEPGVTSYFAEVPGGTSSVTVSAQTEDPAATVTINGMTGTSRSLSLAIGSNPVTLIVTAPGGAIKIYDLDITRAAMPNNPEPIPDTKPDPVPTPGPRPDSGSGSNPSSDSDSNSNSNPPGALTPTSPSPAIRQAKVMAGEREENVARVEITRTLKNGVAVDSVTFGKSKADEIVAKAAATGAGMARIVVDDIPGQPADEVNVSISKEALLKLKEGNLGLAIEAGGAKISLPIDSLGQLNDDGKDLYFRVVPIRKPSETETVQDRVESAQEFREYAMGRNARAVGQPMTIETNYTNRATKVMFPLTGIDLPEDAQDRKNFLNGLAVFIEHSDGEKELEFGQPVYDETGHPIGIEIDVRKFSTFTIISTEADYKTYLRYISGYPDGKFHPAESVTRAEMARLIAIQTEFSEGAGVNPYSDLAASHWAAKAVLQLTGAGILSGDLSGRFRPEAGVTRAEMAVIASRLQGLELTNTSEAFTDTQGHWAAGAINAVREAGYMLGYEDGSFRPNQTMSRAEAIVVLNRLFDRPLLDRRAIGESSWSDVHPASWAAPDIESASRNLRVHKNGSVEIAAGDEQ